MPLSRAFRETIMARAQQDSGFRAELISKAIAAFLARDVDQGKRLLRDYLNATDAFRRVAGSLTTDEKSLRRMLGPKGNPTLKNFIALLHACQQQEQIRFEVLALHQADATPAALPSSAGDAGNNPASGAEQQPSSQRLSRRGKNTKLSQDQPFAGEQLAFDYLL